MLRNPPADAVLALVHSVDPSAGAAGVVHIYCAATPEMLQNVNAIVLGNLAPPLGLLSADTSCSPYLQLLCLANEGTGAAAIKSRRNLARAGQLAQT